MADEAFALSPISARPVMPSDADYDAIREAFMETSRGRWFLSEYAKRNRNADTRMVLDAVERIEQTIAAQKQTGGETSAESFIAIRAMIGEAQASVAKAVAVLDDSVTLTAAFKAARIIHEVASTLRECGADTRICDLLDQQVTAIDSGHRLLAAIDRDAIDGAFERMLELVGELSGGGGAPRAAPASEPNQPAARAPGADASGVEAAAAHAPPHPAGAMAEPAAAAADAVIADAQVAAQAADANLPSAAADDLEFVEPQAAAGHELDIGTPHAPVDAGAGSEAGYAEASAPAAFAAPQTDHDAELLLDEVIAIDAELAEDDAVLDLVAREMSAPDVSASDEPAAYQPPAWEEPVPVELSVAAIAPDIAEIQQAVNENGELESLEMAALDESMLAAAADSSSALLDDAEDSVQAAVLDETALQPIEVAPPLSASLAAAPADAATDEDPEESPPSLGEALLASGVVANPMAVRGDVLAPIRRMTQAEKIAFFS